MLDYVTELRSALKKLDLHSIREVTELLYETKDDGKNIYIFGNGGSAATASHFANDLNKLGYKAICLNDNIPMVTAYANDMGFMYTFSEQLASFISPLDVVIGISTSGNSPNVLEAIRKAGDIMAVTVGITGISGGELGDMVDYCIYAPTEYQKIQEDIHLIICHIISDTIARGDL